jgi:hypothetical protein
MEQEIKYKKRHHCHAGSLVFTHKCLRDAVIPAGIAGIHDCKDAGGRATQEQLPRSHGWLPKLATSLAMRNCLAQSSFHILVFWFPAIPAGMTRFSILVYNDERRSVGTIVGYNLLSHPLLS